MFSHIIYFLIIYLVVVFYPKETLQYQPYRQLNQFGSVQDYKPRFRKPVSNNPVLYQPQLFNDYDSSYLIPHSRELHSVHNRINEDYESMTNNQVSHHKNHKGQIKHRQNLVHPKMARNLKSHLKDEDKDTNEIKAKDYRRDAKVIDYPDFLSKEGIIPYYQSMLGPSLRMKRSATSNTTRADQNKAALKPVNEDMSNNDALIKSLEDSFSNPEGSITKEDLEASFVPHIRVKRILEGNQ